MGFPLTARYLRLPKRKHFCCKEITSDELVQVEEQQKTKLLQSGASCGDDDDAPYPTEAWEPRRGWEILLPLPESLDII